MKNLFLAIFTLMGVSAWAGFPIPVDSVSGADQQDQRYLIKRLDSPTYKGYLAEQERHSTMAIGLFDPTTQLVVAGVTTAPYAAGVPGTYPLLDVVTGKQLVIPAATLITDVKVYNQTALLTGSTVAVGWSGSTGALLATTPTSTMTVDTVLPGVATGSAATTLVSTATQNVTMTLTGATVSSGRAYFMLRLIPGLN